MRMEVIHGSRVVPKAEQAALLIGVSERIRERSEQRKVQRPARLGYAHERGSVKRLVDAVEARLVDALWTLARLPNGGSGGRCGLAYIHDKTEIFANAVSAGDWQRPHPGAPPPKSIDAMHEPLSWLTWIPRDLAGIVRAAASSKSGQPKANVAWGRVRDQVPEARGLTIRTLQRRYEAGLRSIALKLSLG